MVWRSADAADVTRFGLIVQLIHPQVDTVVGSFNNTRRSPGAASSMTYPNYAGGVVG